MGMKSLKWEGIGTKNLFPHTSTQTCWCRVNRTVLRTVNRTRNDNHLAAQLGCSNSAHFLIFVMSLCSQLVLI